MIGDDICRYADLFGPSGREDIVREEIKRTCSEFTKHIREDAAGNLYVMLPATDLSTRRTPVVLSAHIDEIGFVVTRVDGEIAKISPVGMWNPAALLGAPVVLDDGTRSVFGVVGTAPVHWRGRSTRLTFNDLWVDCAARVSSGEMGVIHRHATRSFTRVMGRALDNRAGVAALVAALHVLSSADLSRPVIAIFTVHEETNGMGAQKAAHAVREMFRSVAWPITSPAKCCVVDATFATDDGTRDDEVNCRKYGPVALGGGPVVCPSATTTAGALAWLQRGLKLCARSSQPYQTMPYASDTATDADMFSQVPWLDSVLLAYPLRNMHSPVEIVDIDDIDAVSTTLVGLCTG